MLRPTLLILLLVLGILPPAGADPTLDLMPLKKALAPFEGSQAIQSHTTIHATGSQNGNSLALHEDLQITARRPGRFNAKLTQFGSNGALQTRLLVISNGTKVWIYQPNLHQYTITGYQDFVGGDSAASTLGLIVGGFYLGDGHPMIQGFQSLTASNSAEVLAALSAMDITLTRHAQSVAGHDDYVYSMTLTKQNLAYLFYVDSQTDRLNRIDLTITQSDSQVTFREDIAQIAPLQAVSKSTFQFLPLPGTRKAASVSTNPFSAR